MSEQYPGGFITKTNPTVDGSTARGLWTLSQAAGYAKQGLWPTVPAAPTIGTATAGSGSASVAFTAPSNIGSSAITSYTATSSPGGFTGTGASSPITVSGLTNGTAYTFTVTATNGAGTSPASAASNSVTPNADYIEDVFSTWLYTGNGSTQTITNGIDLAGKGGMVWLKSRSNVQDNCISDSALGIGSGGYYSRLITNSTAAANTAITGGPSAFNSNGWSGGGGTAQWNTSGATYASWTFRKQPKFFDVVTYTGNGTAGRTVAHSLGSVPGCMIVRPTSAVDDWFVYHRSLLNSQSLFLNLTTAASNTPSAWNSTTPTSTEFTVGTNTATNANGVSYVAYLFAHNAGGFGLTGTDNVISCGSFTTDGSGNATVSLGYEPQWLLLKQSGAVGNWQVFDNLRGFATQAGSTPNPMLNPNLSSAESSEYPGPLSTGFNVVGYGASTTWIYIAIRRGPMKVPTSGTSVFAPVAYSGNSANRIITSNFPVDLALNPTARTGTNADKTQAFSRLTGTTRLATSNTNAETAATTNVVRGFDNNIGLPISTSGDINLTGNTYVNWLFQRAPSFMDVVCYTGNGSVPQTVPHNLGVVPELMIVKNRSDVTNWATYNATNGPNYYMNLNSTAAAAAQIDRWRNTAPTSTNFYVGATNNVSGNNYVAYLFATCAGVSKVGSYTGTGATQTIDCGFTSGARFVLVKRTDSTGDWYVWDTARGMVSGTDPSLLLNSTAAEVNANSIYTTTGGFQIVSTAAGINASGGTYIYLAIA